MATTQPHPPAPGTVKATLTGDPSDLLTTAIFLHGVTGGDNPGNVLHMLGLAAIRIAHMTRRGGTLTITLQLEPAAP